MWMQDKRKNEGFSIVELMTVVVIIAFLAMMAFNTYKSATAKARQSEAKVNLKQIGDLMDAWQYEKGAYPAAAKLGTIGAGANNCQPADLKNELGYRPKDCDELRYRYNITARAAGTFTVTAFNDPDDTNYGYIYPGCNIEDQWTNNQKGQIRADAAKNVLTKCE